MKPMNMFIRGEAERSKTGLALKDFDIVTSANRNDPTSLFSAQTILLNQYASNNRKLFKNGKPRLLFPRNANGPVPYVRFPDGSNLKTCIKELSEAIETCTKERRTRHSDLILSSGLGTLIQQGPYNNADGYELNLLIGKICPNLLPGGVTKVLKALKDARTETEKEFPNKTDLELNSELLKLLADDPSYELNMYAILRRQKDLLVKMLVGQGKQDFRKQFFKQMDSLALAWLHDEKCIKGKVPVPSISADSYVQSTIIESYLEKVTTKLAGLARGTNDGFALPQQILGGSVTATTADTDTYGQCLTIVPTRLDCFVGSIFQVARAAFTDLC